MTVCMRAHRHSNLDTLGGEAEIHESQLLTYQRLTGCRVGLLINFDERKLMDGVKRLVL